LTDMHFGALRLLVQTDLRSWEWHYEWLSRVSGFADEDAEKRKKKKK
jgi:hypothetical protein